MLVITSTYLLTCVDSALCLCVIVMLRPKTISRYIITYSTDWCGGLQFVCLLYDFSWRGRWIDPIGDTPGLFSFIHFSSWLANRLMHAIFPKKTIVIFPKHMQGHDKPTMNFVHDKRRLTIVKIEIQIIVSLKTWRFVLSNTLGQFIEEQRYVELTLPSILLHHWSIPVLAFGLTRPPNVKTRTHASRRTPALALTGIIGVRSIPSPPLLQYLCTM